MNFSNTSNLCDCQSVDTGAGDISFEATDRLGRVIGTRWRKTTDTYSPVPEGKTYGYRREPGVAFSYTTQATRDGKGHQASHSFSFKTEAERDAALAKAIEGARKRALRPEARTKA